MSRNQRDKLLRLQHKHVKSFPNKLTALPSSEYPDVDPRPNGVWRSNKYLVQMFVGPEAIRLSICRVQLGADGRWNDKLTWDELQAIKAEIGFGDYYAIEVYPREQDVINVANFRHLWILPQPLQIGWFK